MKTVANDLDNVMLSFDNVRLAKATLLNKYCDVTDNAIYEIKGERLRIEIIGSRLLTGRLCERQSTQLVLYPLIIVCWGSVLKL